MSWLTVIQLLILMLGAMCTLCIAISVYNDGKAKAEFVRAHGRYPTKAEANVE